MFTPTDHHPVLPDVLLSGCLQATDPDRVPPEQDQASSKELSVAPWDSDGAAATTPPSTGDQCHAVPGTELC